MIRIYTFQGIKIKFQIDEDGISVCCDDIIKLHLMLIKSTTDIYCSLDTAIELTENSKNDEAYRWLMRCISEMQNIVP